MATYFCPVTHELVRIGPDGKAVRAGPGERPTVGALFNHPHTGQLMRVTPSGYPEPADGSGGGGGVITSGGLFGYNAGPTGYLSSSGTGGIPSVAASNFGYSYGYSGYPAATSSFGSSSFGSGFGTTTTTTYTSVGGW
eukprot:RCo050284